MRIFLPQFMNFLILSSILSVILCADPPPKPHGTEEIIIARSSTTARTTSNVTYEDEDEEIAKAIVASLNETPVMAFTTTLTSTNTITVTTTTTLSSPSISTTSAINSLDANDYNYSEEELKEMLRFYRRETPRRRWLELLTKPGVGELKETVKSLAWTLFWYVRAMQLNDPLSAHFSDLDALVTPSELESRKQSFRNALRDLQSLSILDESDKNLGELDRQFHSVREYVASGEMKPSAEAAKTLCCLWKHAMLTVDKNAGHFCLILALETKDVLLLNAIRWFSVHNSSTFPKLSESEWHWLMAIAGRETAGKFMEKMLRLIGAHGPKDLRNVVLGMNLFTVEVMLTPLYVANTTIRIPVLDLGKADRPEFNPHIGEFKTSANYREFIKALGEYIRKRERSDSLTVQVYKKENGVESFIDFEDAGGPRRAFLTAFGMLFQVHEHVMIESEKGSLCIHPMASEEVYSYFANMLGLLARANYTNDTSLKVSIGYFLVPEYAEFLFDPDFDRIPTKEEIRRFFPHIEKDFTELYSKSPEDTAGVYDTRHSIGFTEIINEFNVGKLGDVQVPKDEADLWRLKEKYVEKIQVNLIHGHHVFIRNLLTFSKGHYDYENFDLLIVRREELDADQVIKALKFVDCEEKTVMCDDQGGRQVSFEVAFKRMVREMTSKEHENMFIYGTGSVPPVLTYGCLEIRGNGTCARSWSASSCSGYICPPEMAPGSNTHNYTVLFESFKSQCAMDAGSTGGNETTI